MKFTSRSLMMGNLLRAHLNGQSRKWTTFPMLEWRNTCHGSSARLSRLQRYRQVLPLCLNRRCLITVPGSWVADFETVNDPDDCRVWCWGLVPVSSNCEPVDVEHGTDIVSFIHRVAYVDATVYFHNLSFDGAFIMDYLLKDGYRYCANGRPSMGEFSACISELGQHYSILVKFREGGVVEFRDSCKLLPMTVAAIAKSFELPMAKGSIDYNANRPVGHLPTPDERAYVDNDVLIVSRALFTVLTESHGKLTVGANSLAEYREIVGGRFRRDFPELPGELDKEIRQSYRGGWTYLSERYRNCHVTEPGIVLDVNSLYPFVMKECLIPFGMPEYYVGDPRESGADLFVTTITFTAALKDGHLPCIQVKGHSIFTDTEYLMVIDEPTTLSFTNVDLELIMDHYDVDILEWCGSWLFSGKYGLYDEYIHKWSTIKENSSGGLRALAKLHLNSLYGKFGTNPEVAGKHPELTDDGVVRLVVGDVENRQSVYIPAACFITSHARNLTVRAAQRNYDRFIYADTDSLHLLGDELPELDVDPRRLGAWKREMTFSEAFYKRAKCYAERNADTGLLETHIAGLPREIAGRVEIEHFKDGHTYRGKLLPRRVSGGIVLLETEFRLSHD